MTDYAAGMKRAAEIARNPDEWASSSRVPHEAIADTILAAIQAEDDDNRESPEFRRGWNAAMEAQGLEVIDPAPAPWTPPPEAARPDGYRCLGWISNERWSGWMVVQWLDGDWMHDEIYMHANPTAFSPLPPASEQGDAK